LSFYLRSFFVVTEGCIGSQETECLEAIEADVFTGQVPFLSPSIIKALEGTCLNMLENVSGI